MEFNEIISELRMPKDIEAKVFEDGYFNEIQELYKEEGWMSFVNRSDEAKEAWKNSQVALVVLKDGKVVGLLRAITDGCITTYIAEILICKEVRGKGLGNLLLDICHRMYPRTRLDLLSSESADVFYRKNNFKEITGFRRSYV